MCYISKVVHFEITIYLSDNEHFDIFGKYEELRLLFHIFDSHFINISKTTHFQTGEYF